MNIAVIAANGRTGKPFVEAALAAGHTVTAGVRGAHSFDDHPNLRVVSCDATNPDDVKKLLKGQEAVASFIGHVRGSSKLVQTDATKVLVSTMQKLGIKRFVSLTGTGVRFPGDRLTVVDHLSTAVIGLVDRKRLADGITHAEVLKASQLDWTILRVTKLQNTRPRPYTLQVHGPSKYFTSRKEVANAALDVIENGTFIKEAPMIGHAS